MSRMTESQRTQFARPDLTAPTTGVHVRSARPLVIYTVIALIVLAALGWATVEALDGWARFVVLAGIVITAIGGAIAVSPNRRA